MRRTVAVLAVALAACSFNLQKNPKDLSIESTFLKQATVTELPGQFKFATFNIHKEPGDKVAKAILADRELREVDLFVMQEVPRWGDTCSAACDLGKRLGMHALYAPGHIEGDKDMGIAILSKAPILSAQILELPWNDVRFNAGRRHALVATVTHAGKPITVYAVHLENRLKASARRRQMLPILEHAKQQDTPVILAGDFNTNPFTWVSHWLPLPTGAHQARKLEALVRSYGFDTPVKDSGATHRYIGMKLDAIYTRGFETRRFATARAQDVSDHLALWATMRPNEQAMAAWRSKHAPKDAPKDAPVPARTAAKSVAAQ